MAEDEDTVLERRSLILKEVYETRAEQINKGYTLEHDLEHGVMHIFDEFFRRYYKSLRNNAFTRESLIEDAALLVAAVEVMDTQARV